MAEETTSTETQGAETTLPETLETLTGAPVPSAPAATRETEPEHREEAPPADPDERKAWDKDQQKKQQEAANSEKKKLADRLGRLEEAAKAKDEQIDRLLSIVEQSQKPAAEQAQQKSELDDIQADYDLADKVRQGESPEGESRIPEEIEAQASRKMLAYTRKREQYQTQSQRQNEERQKALDAAKVAERKGWEEFSRTNPDVPVKKAIALRDEIWSELDEHPAVTAAIDQGGESAGVAVKKALLDGQFNTRLATLKKSAPPTTRSPARAPAEIEQPTAGGARPQSEQPSEVGSRLSKFLGLDNF